MQGFKDLLASERGVFAIFVLIAITILRSQSLLTEDNFVTVLTALTGALILSKTITGYAEIKSASSGSVPASGSVPTQPEPKP